MAHYTLHTDESGSFEGDAPRGIRLIAGLLLPALDDGAIDKLRSGVEEIALEVFGKRSLSALHASDLRKWPHEQRDALALRLLAELNGVLPGGQRGRLVVLVHERDAQTAPKDDPLASPAFAANRYQRVLVELVHQVLQTVPGPEVGDRIALHLASRVFEVSEADIDSVKDLGYWPVKDRRTRQVKRGKHGRPLVHIGDQASIRAAIQTLMGTQRSVRASAESLELTSIGKSKDPRFAIVDFLSNYVFRRSHIFRRGDWRSEVGLPKLDVTAMRFGPALDVLTHAWDGLAHGDIVQALEALEGVTQPPIHEPMMSPLLEALAKSAGRALRSEPRLADRLLDRADRILEYRQYSLLKEAERLAKVVLRNKQVSSASERRANAVVGTAANHRGAYRVAADALESAIEATNRDAPSIGLLLERIDLENRRAVTEMNLFRFDIDGRLEPYLKFVDELTTKYLGAGARERVAGEMAGTLAQAACHRRDWRRAKRCFDLATRHLGEDHMQAAYRAHAAIERRNREAALAAASEALGSSYGREGYDTEEGARRLDDPLETIRGSISEAPFDAWLVVKLVDAGWIGDRSQLAAPIAEVLRADESRHHPHMLIRLAAGRAADAGGHRSLAITIWRDAYARWKKEAKLPTIGAIRLQLAAHLALAGAPDLVRRTKSGRRSLAWGDVLMTDARELVKRHGDLAAFLQPSVRALKAAEGDVKATKRALRAFLSEFSFLYR